ncbi:MAG: LysM domain-containing protein, partial [Muribaculaceae bacterium]|nr:LysM domain-containing protein [Muribaculaceae bacterium]
MKYKLKHLILSLGLFLAVSPVLSARDLPVTTIGGRECYVYEVKKGVNIYDVAKELKISTGVITGLNPSAADGLRPGMHLYFPKYVLDGGPQVTGTDNVTEPDNVRNVVTTETDESTSELPTVVDMIPLQPAKKTVSADKKEVDRDLPATYTVKKGESLYGISHKFGLTVE